MQRSAENKIMEDRKMYAAAMKSKKENQSRGVAHHVARRKRNEKPVHGVMDNQPKATDISRSQAAGNNKVTQAMPKKENETGLPNNLKEGIENLSGYSMDDVKVHYNSPRPAQLHAHAYTQGSDVHIAPGQDKHLPHEAWHVVQQKQGRVKPTIRLKGVGNVNIEDALETEAEIMGTKAIQPPSPMAPSETHKGKIKSPAPPVQAFGLEELWSIAEGLGLSYVALFTALATIGITALYTLLKKCKSNDEAQAAIAEATKEESEPPLFSEPTTLQELHNYIDRKQYPPGIRTLGEKEDWAERTARGLRLKTPAKIRNRVRRVEGAILQSADTSYYDVGVGASSSSVSSPAPTPKIKTRGAATGPAAAPPAVAALPSGFVFNNATTWNKQPIMACSNFPGIAALNIAPNYITALKAGLLTNNSTAGGASVNTNYHAHANGGKSGFAFRYVHAPGTSNVTPTIYDFAYTRTGKSGNIYQWTNHPASNTAPTYP
jgi:hypothetical protein